MAAGDGRQTCTITATRSGYIQAIDLDSLIQLATTHDLCLRLTHRPGPFLIQGNTLVLAWPDDRIDEALIAQINRAFIVGTQRTLEQDVEFAIDQLVEVALRALSPSINDPFTGMACVDWLGVSFCLLTERRIPPSDCYDAQGRLRVMTNPVTYAGIAEAALNPLRQAARTHVVVTLRLLEMLAVIVARTRNADHRATLVGHAALIMRGSAEDVPEAQDQKTIEARYQAITRLIETLA